MANVHVNIIERPHAALEFLHIMRGE